MTVNADQAVVTDTMVTGVSGNNPLSSAKMLTTGTANLFRMPDMATPEPELVTVGRGKEPK